MMTNMIYVLYMIYMMIYDNICLGNIHLKQIPKSHCPKTKHREILRAAFRGPHHR